MRRDKYMLFLLGFFAPHREKVKFNQSSVNFLINSSKGHLKGGAKMLQICKHVI